METITAGNIEDKVLGALVNSRKLFFMVGKDIKEDFFSNPIASQLFRKMQESHAKTSQEFKAEIVCDNALIAGYMSTLDLTAQTPATIKPLIIRLTNDAKLRLIATTAQTLNNLATQGSVDTALTALSALNDNLLNFQGESDFCIDTTIKDIVTRQIDSLDGIGLGLSTGLNNIDRYTKLKPNEVTVLAARSSIGKTALALNIANHRLQQGDNGLIISAEMSSEALLRRMIFLNAGIPLKTFDPSFEGATDGGSQMFTNSSEEVKKYKLDIFDKSLPEIDEVCAKIRANHSKEPLDWAMIDYAQILSVKGNKTPIEKITEISQKTKALARDINIPIILIAQLNRQAENKEPQLSELAGSASLENDADVVWLLHRDRKEQMEQDEPNTPVLAKLLIPKNRDGETGITTIKFLPSQTKFEDASKFDIDEAVNKFTSKKKAGAF